MGPDLEEEGTSATIKTFLESSETSIKDKSSILEHYMGKGSFKHVALVLECANFSVDELEKALLSCNRAFCERRCCGALLSRLHGEAEGPRKGVFAANLLRLRLGRNK